MTIMHLTCDIAIGLSRFSCYGLVFRTFLRKTPLVLHSTGQRQMETTCAFSAYIQICFAFQDICNKVDTALIEMCVGEKNSGLALFRSTPHETNVKILRAFLMSFFKPLIIPRFLATAIILKNQQQIIYLQTIQEYIQRTYISWGNFFQTIFLIFFCDFLGC